MHTQHSKLRTQQRCLPDFIIDLLCKFGEEQYDHRGGIIRHFNKNSRRKLHAYVGNQLYAQIEKYTDAYAVFALDSEKLITAGHRFKHVLN